jgi:hypothetical protein
MKDLVNLVTWSQREEPRVQHGRPSALKIHSLPAQRGHITREFVDPFRSKFGWVCALAHLAVEADALVMG